MISLGIIIVLLIIVILILTKLTIKFNELSKAVGTAASNELEKRSLKGTIGELKAQKYELEKEVNNYKIQLDRILNALNENRQ